MASKANKTRSATKKATAKKDSAKKGSAKKATAKKGAKKAKKKPAPKKPAPKKAAAKKAKAKKPTVKNVAAKKAVAKKAAVKTSEPTPTETIVAVDAQPPVVTPPGRTRSPQTPSVPRSVKPPPKDANLEMSEEILQFVEAIDSYRQVNSRPFPTWTEIFHVLRQLGYSRS